jgi:hypothetical protein
VESRDCTQTRFPRATVTATVTVAELVARHAAGTGPDRPVAPEAAELDADETPTRAISVAALLRREGTGPRRADRPLVPRGHSRPAPAPAGASWRRNVRKATTAAGVLFAAGAVFGSALVDNAVPDRAAADDAAGAPDGGGPGGAGEEALRAFGAEATGTGAGAPVNGATLASAALWSADAVPGSVTGAPEDGDPRFASVRGAGAQPTFRSSVFPIGEPPSGAGRRGGRAEGPAGGAVGPRAEPGGPGNGGSGSGGPAGGSGRPGNGGSGSGGPAGEPDGGPGEEPGKDRGPSSAGSDERGSGNQGPGGPSGPGTGHPAPTPSAAPHEASTPRAEVPGTATDGPVVGRARTGGQRSATPGRGRANRSTEDSSA